MKKIIVFCFVCMLGIFCANVYAQSYENGVMPSDEEIMKAIQKYNFSKEQEAFIFKETKKRLQKLYDEQAAVTEENENSVNSKNYGSAPSNYSHNNKKIYEVQEMPKEKPVQEKVTPSQVNKTPDTKKYSKHDPISKRAVSGEKKYSKHDPISKRKQY